MDNREGAGRFTVPMKYGPDLNGNVAYGLRTGFIIADCRICWGRISGSDLHHELSWPTGHRDRVHTDCFERMVGTGYYVLADANR